MSQQTIPHFASQFERGGGQSFGASPTSIGFPMNHLEKLRQARAQEMRKMPNWSQTPPMKVKNESELVQKFVHPNADLQIMPRVSIRMCRFAQYARQRAGAPALGRR
jgi:hypothetical protein